MVERRRDAFSIEVPDGLDRVIKILPGDKPGRNSIERLESCKEALEAFAFGQIKKQRFYSVVSPELSCLVLPGAQPGVKRMGRINYRVEADQPPQPDC
jgi:hypothetical protein